MIPIADSPPRERAPVVTWVLVALNVWMFARELLMPAQALDPFFREWGLVPARLTGDFGPAALVTLVSSTFLHGGLAHLVGNLWTLWIFGDNVEDRLGRARFLAFYALCGIAAGAIHVAFNPSSPLPTVGASGAISGVLGAYLLLFPRAQLLLLFPVIFYPVFLTVPAVLYLVLWFALQFASGTAAFAGGDGVQGGVAWWAHVGGFVAGALLLRTFLARRPEPPEGPTRGRLKRAWGWEAEVSGRETPPSSWTFGRRRP